MNKLERLAFWKTVAADAARTAGHDKIAAELEAMVWKSEDDLFAFFAAFQPDGKGVEKVFEGIVGGDEIVQRLLPVYQITQVNSWGYFIVRRPAHATQKKLLDLTKQHLEKMRQIAHDAGESELESLLAPLPKIEITREPEPDRRMDVHGPESFIYCTRCDWVIDLKPAPSDALLLGEAFYSIACDYCIAEYLMWPLYRDCTSIEEPFGPYFELWTHGARAWFEKPGLVTVYVRGDS